MTVLAAASSKRSCQAPSNRSAAETGEPTDWARIELLGGEVQRLAVERGQMRAQVHLDGAGGKQGGGSLGRCLASAQARLHAGHQLAGPEGLGDVVLGAQGEADDLVGLLVLRREEDDGNVPHLAHATAQLEAVDARHHDIHDGQVERRAGEHVQGRLSAVAGQRVHALGHEQVDNQIGDGLLVVHHQYVSAFFHKGYCTRFVPGFANGHAIP